MSDAGADPLELESLDTDALLAALANVEKAVPDLLLGVKPVLAHLSSPSANTDENAAIAARDAVENYMNTLDKIQFILRQTVYYLRETRAAPSVLRPSGVDAIPRPLAATLRSDAGPTPGGADASLGLYGARQEVAALREMVAALKVMRAQAGEGEGEGEEEGDREGAEGDGGGDEVPGADDRMDAD
ncbi:uncharacterized protein EHS24_009439 [Apiotrichum porosum]|uniref:Mediator of RNA polymerase II transcription subunit 11 n=1 Tax=Apiotrichum porosum TaxID=105984 RepID=A0A427XLK3_9TREE|nr:uncharacterized protein EHS24_009439 [Apiotrichum porosum]RSH79781.1 hypothetical protein EHS24_009439 [Apiotrichum porosum]